MVQKSVIFLIQNRGATDVPHSQVVATKSKIVIKWVLLRMVFEPIHSIDLEAIQKPLDNKPNENKPTFLIKNTSF